MLSLKKVYNYSKILQIECIKKEIEEFIKGYNIKNIKLNGGIFECSFENDNGDSLYVNFETKKDAITMCKYTNNLIERVTINEKLLMTHKIIEKRPNGILYSIINKQFDLSNRFRNQTVLVDLTEQRLVFTKDNLQRLISSINFDTDKLSLYILKFIGLESKLELSKECDYYTEFSTHMNKYVSWLGGRRVKDNIYPTKTFLNGEDVSSVFNITDNSDKLYRVYDLYRGIINYRNEIDINSINLGLLSSDAFGYKEFRGITKQENSLIGETQLKVPESYVNYLKELFFINFGYTGKIIVDRISLLSAILYKMSELDKAKYIVETHLGIPYEEYLDLGVNEQHELIKKKTGKEVKLDYTYLTSGLTMEQRYYISKKQPNYQIFTSEQANRQIDEMNTSGSLKAIKRLLRGLTKK